MSWKVDDLCEVKVGGRWLETSIHELDVAGHPRVRNPLTGKLVRVGPGKLRRPGARVVVRRTAGAEVEAPEIGVAEGFGVRSVGTVAAPVELVPQPKPSTPRSRSHLDFVRALPCAWCKTEGRTQASHHGLRGTSIKAPDYRAIPLCVECHQHHGDHFTLPKSAMNPDQTREWFKDRALDVCSRRLEER